MSEKHSEGGERDWGDGRRDRGEGAVTGEDVAKKTQTDKEEGGGGGGGCEGMRMERWYVRSGDTREKEKCGIL